MSSLDKLVTTGIVAGDVHTSYRHDLIESATPEAPENAPDEEEDASDADRPEYTDLAEPTVNCICAKRDT